MPPKFSEEELELLTEEEREGLLEEEDDDDAGDGDDSDDTAGADDTAGGDDDDAAVLAGTPAAEAAAAAAAAAADANKVAPAPVAADTPAADGTTTPVEAGAVDDGPVIEHDPNERAPSWLAATDNDAKLKAIDEKRDELAKTFDDGDLTAEEMRAQLKPLDAEYRALERAEIKREVARENAVEGWLGEVGTFLEGNPQYKSGVLNGLLDAEVKKLQSEAVNPFNPKLLERAHANIAKQVKEAFGVETPGAKTPEQKPATPATPAAAAKPAAKPRPDMPPSLSNIPAADITDADDGGEFAHLDRLAAKDSVSFEKELAKLSPEAQNRYLAQ